MPERCRMATSEIKSDSETLSTELQRELDLLLFGSAPDTQDVTRWQGQGFTFSNSIPFGLTQLYGGPCGILAPVQAYVLKYLVFETSNPVPLFGELPQANEALVFALTSMLMQARSRQNVRVVLGESLSSLKCYTCNTADQIRSLLNQHVAVLQSPIGVLLFVYSMLLTRGVKEVKADMDPPQEQMEQCLVARFGHCSQDLVNLMLTGRAVTNVFDLNKEVGGVTLKGVQAQGDIGFLSLLEALRYTKVGENFKTPKFPIWVVGSASHYTVLFGLDKTIGQLSESEKLLRTAKQAFSELDPEENGFIPTVSIAQVLSRLDIQPAAIDQVTRTLDPTSLGLCLWPDFANFVTNWRTEHVNWSCTACTFLNPTARTMCEICNSPKPALPPTPTPQPSKNRPKAAFELLHFNGIVGHSQASAALCKVTVTPQDQDGFAQGEKVDKQGLREVVRTKWPGAYVTYEGGEPKIV